MLSNTDTSLSPSSKTRFDDFCARWGVSGIYKRHHVRRKFAEIDNEKDPIAAAIKLRELYKELELTSMFIAELARKSFPEDFISIGPEYASTQAYNRYVVKINASVALMLSTKFFSISFIVDKSDPDYYEGIFQKNIVTRYVDLDCLAGELINLDGQLGDQAKVMSNLNDFYLQSLNNVRFIQSQLLEILRFQKPHKVKIERFITEQTKKSNAQLHLDRLIAYLDENRYTAYINEKLSSLIRNATRAIPASGYKQLESDLIIFLNTFKSCEIYALDAFHTICRSKTGFELFIYLSTDDVNLLRQHDKFMKSLGQAKTEEQANGLNYLYTEFVNQAKLQEDIAILAGIADLNEFKFNTILLERIAYNIFIMLDLMEYQLRNNERPHVLATPNENWLVKSIGKEKLKPLSVSAYSSPTASAVEKIEPSKKNLSASLLIIKNEISQLQQSYRSIYRNPALRKIAEHQDAEQLISFGVKITDVILVKYEGIHSTLADSDAMLVAIETNIEILNAEISKFKKSLDGYVKNLNAIADKENPDRALSKTELVRLELEKKAQRKREEEERRLEEKPKTAKAPHARPAPEVKTAPVKINTATKPLETKKSDATPYDPLRISHLSEACKNLIFIRLILSLDDFDKDLKHYALLYNIFRCFQSLKRYQECGGMKNSINPDEIVNLRNMIIHHGINAVCKESVEDFAATIVGNLPQALSRLNRNDLFRNPLNEDARADVIREFGLYERGALNLSFFNHAKLVIDSTPLYQKLKKFHEAKLNNEPQMDEYKIILESYVPLMKKITASLNKVSQQDRNKNSAMLINAYLFELQALRMLAIICGELARSQSNKLNINFFNFLNSTVHIRNNTGHALQDMESPLHFLEQITKLLNAFDEKQLLRQLQSPSASTPTTTRAMPTTLFARPASSATQSAPQAESQSKLTL